MTQDNQDALDETGYWGRSAAGAILFSPKKKMFGLGLRSQAVEQPGTLGTFGGAIEPGDSIEETISNELMEELGYFYPPVLRELKAYEDGAFKYSNFVAVIDDDSFDPILNWENDEIRWLSLEELQSCNKDDLHFGVSFILKDEGSLHILRSMERASKYDRSNEQEFSF